MTEPRADYATAAPDRRPRVDIACACGRLLGRWLWTRCPDGVWRWCIEQEDGEVLKAKFGWCACGRAVRLTSSTRQNGRTFVTMQAGG